MHRFVTERLRHDHENIGRVLSLMRVQLELLTANNAEGLTMLSTATNYLIHFPGVLHHPLEEVMADVVLASEPATTYMRGRLVREHSALATGAADFAARVSLQQLGRGSSVVDLRHAGVDFILAYGDHIQFEESQVLPMALDVLNETQWQDIRTKMISKHDPLFARDRLRLYDNLYDAVLGESAQIMSQPKH